MIDVEILDKWLKEGNGLVSLIESLIKHCNAHETALSKLTERVDALEYHSHGYRDAHGYLVETEDQTYRQPPDLSDYRGKYKPVQGSWICDKCHADWGGGNAPSWYGTCDSRDIDQQWGCPDDKNRGGCGGVGSVTWHPAQTVGKPSEVPTSSVHYRWCDVDETAPDPEEPKPYPQAAENANGTQEPTTTGHTVHVPNDLTKRTMDETDRGEDLTTHESVEALMDDLNGTQELKPCLDAIITVIDNMLGDTDPDIPEDLADEDIKTEEPLFWVMRELVKYRPIEDELRQKLADMQIEYDRSEREREGAVDEIDTLKETNRLLRVEVKRLGAMPSCDPTACWHVHAREELAKENAALRADLAAAQAKVDNALALARANLTYYEEDPECAPIRVTCVPVDLRRIIAALDK